LPNVEFLSLEIKTSTSTKDLNSVNPLDLCKCHLFVILFSQQNWLFSLGMCTLLLAILLVTLKSMLFTTTKSKLSLSGNTTNQPYNSQLFH
jgi:hypothetical protein